MTRHFVCKVQTFSFVVVVVFVATIALLASSAALAEGAGPLAAKPTSAFLTQPKPAFTGMNSEGVSFLAPGLSGLGCIPFSIAVGDVNGDGKPDLVVVDSDQNCSGAWSTGEVEVRLGSGDGTFQAPVSYASGGFQALGVAVGDVNDDGKLDLVVVSSCGSGSATCHGQVGVLLGDGDGTFRPVSVYDSGGSLPYGVTIADVNGDGHPDLVVANGCRSLSGDGSRDGSGGGCTSPGSAGVLLGNGDGTFRTAVIYPAGANSNVTSLAVGDVNGDGHADVVMVGGQMVGGQNQAVVSVLMGNGDGTFRPEVSYDGGGSQPNFVAVADVNGDGHPDVVVASYCMSVDDCNDGGLGVLLGNSDGTFQAPVNYSAGGYGAFSLAIADVNGDGRPDLIATTAYGNGPGNSGPGGAVIFYDGFTVLGKATLAGGNAVLSASSLSSLLLPGSHSITAKYQGSRGVAPSRSGVLANVINGKVIKGGVRFDSHVTVQSSANPIYVGESVTFTAYVTSRQGNIPDGDQVEFTDGARGELGIGLTQGGVAFITTSALPYGVHQQIDTSYLGDAQFAPSYTELKETVDKDPTTTTLTASPNPAAYGQAVTYTATVTSAFPGTPTGTVRLSGSGKVPLVNGVATVTKTLKVGTYTITGAYGGDSIFAESDSPVVDEVVNPAATMTAITSSVNPSSSGESVTFTAVVTSSTGLDPTGDVTFTAGGVTLGTVKVKSTVAKISTATLPVGSNTITATYDGVTDFSGSSASLTQVVQP
jgi:hypothetical protein